MKIAAALDRWQLGRIAQHQNRRAEGEQVLAEFLVDHGAFVDHDQAGGRRRTVALDGELRAGVLVIIVRLFLFLGGAGAVDQRVDGAGILAALLAQDMGGLAGEGAETDIAVNAFGQMPRERGLARAGIAEQTEHLTVAALQPVGGLLQGVILLGGPGHGKVPSNCAPVAYPVFADSTKGRFAATVLPCSFRAGAV